MMQFQVRPLFPNKIKFALLILVIVLAVSVSALYMYAMQETIPRGVRVSGWDVQGISYDQFLIQFKDHLDSMDGQQIVLRSDHPKIPSASFTLHQLGFQSNAKSITDEFLDLFTGSFVKRIKTRWKWRNKSFDLKIAFNEKKLEQTIHEHWGALQSEQPADAVRTITPDDRILYTPEKKASRIDLLQLKLHLEQLFPTPWWTFDFPQPPMSVELPIKQIEPKVTLESLKAEGIERKIAQFSTTYQTSGEGRIHNIQSTAKIVHDKILKPGEVFDYSEVIKQAKEKYGFKPAPVIFNGEFVPGVGGGICQVSSTLYNAVLRSGLEIVERRNHSLPLSYVPLGQDATYSEGYINFKFRNNTGSHLLIRTSTINNTLSIKLFGNLPKDITYEIKSKIIKTLEPPVKYVKNATLAKGQQQIIRKGRTGYLVETYRYKKQGEKTIKEELISKDTYKPQPLIIAINKGEPDQQSGKPASPEQPERFILEDGVSGPILD